MGSPLVLNEFWAVYKSSTDIGSLERFEFDTEAEAQEYAAQHGGTVHRHGAQKDFVFSNALYSAYIGGIGAGKTFSLIAKNLKYATQPQPSGQFHGPRTTLAAATYPHLRDTIYPLADEVITKLGLANWSRDFKRSEKSLKLKTGGLILFRSLDDPDKVVRGPELCHIGLDEGRNLSMYAWRLSIGRLRQAGYRPAASVASTPAGHDWMYSVFHPDSDKRWEGAEWFNAPTSENRTIPRDYIRALTAGYEGRFYQQEVLGKFVGAIEGSVFPAWDPVTFIRPMLYRPDLPLYSFWDFGYGDTGVCIFAQIEWAEKEQLNTPGPKAKIPRLYILDAIDAKEWTSKDWGLAYAGWLDEVGVKKTRADWGDPAGRSRQLATGTSVIDDLNAAGVPVAPTVKRPQDYGIRIVNNLIEGGRLIVADSCNPRMSEALSHHHWKVDADGNIKGDKPVHDWSSHFIDALRYGAMAELSFFARLEDPSEERDEYRPDQMGYFDQLLKNRDEHWLGAPSRPKMDFQPRITSHG